jgi:hypothetical protein
MERTVSPTQLTLRKLRNDGWTAEVVERWNPHARVRNDLWGFVDVLAIKGDVTLGVQTTSASNVAARVHKIADHPNLPLVREAGWRLEVHGWSKKDGRWVVRVVDVS